MKDTKEKPVLSWFPNDIEVDDTEFEWDCFLEDLDELLKKVNPSGYWHCKVENFGWRKQSGYAFLEFGDGIGMIRKVLPKTECSFNIFRDGKNLKIQNFHHDSPVGNEWYCLKPITCKQFENQKM
jgi:hypothetical protein